MAYDDVGALGGLFAPAYISGDQVSADAVARWNAAHLKVPPASDGGAIPPAGGFGAVSPASSARDPSGIRQGFDGGGRPIPEGFHLAPSLYTPGSTAITNGPTYSAPAAPAATGGSIGGTGGTLVNGGPDIGMRSAIARSLMDPAG